MKIKIDNTTKRFSYPTVEEGSQITVFDAARILQDVQKELDKTALKFKVYDFYKITGVVTKSEEFYSKINTLLNNQAVVCNTETSFSTNLFTEEESQNSSSDHSNLFKRGDVIFKDNIGEYHHIQSLTSGWYKPEQSENSNEITFKYETSNVENVSITLPSAPTNTSIYGISETFSEKKSINFVTVTNDETNKVTKILPIIKFYDDNGEEVSTDKYTYSSSNTSFTITPDDDNYVKTLIIVIK